MNIEESEPPIHNRLWGWISAAKAVARVDTASMAEARTALIGWRLNSFLDSLVALVMEWTSTIYMYRIIRALRIEVNGYSPHQAREFIRVLFTVQVVVALYSSIALKVYILLSVELFSTSTALKNALSSFDRGLYLPFLFFNHWSNVFFIQDILTQFKTCLQ